MSKAWYPFYWADYLGDTSHLSLIHHGVYVLLLGHYYRTAKPLPANAMQLHRICRCTNDAERDACAEVVQEFFYLEGGLHRHKRVDLEIAKSFEISDKRSKAARSRHHANAPAIAQQMHEICTTQSQSQSQKKDAASPPPIFSDLKTFKPSELARCFLEHEEICIPVTRFEVEDTAKALEAIQTQEKLASPYEALQFALDRAKKYKAKGKDINPGWMRKKLYNEPAVKKQRPMVNPLDILEQQKQEALAEAARQ